MLWLIASACGANSFTPPELVNGTVEHHPDRKHVVGQNGSLHGMPKAESRRGWSEDKPSVRSWGQASNHEAPLEGSDLTSCHSR